MGSPGFLMRHENCDARPGVAGAAVFSCCRGEGLLGIKMLECRESLGYRNKVTSQERDVCAVFYL